MQEIHDALRDHAASVPELSWFWHGYVSEMIRDSRDLDGNRVFDELHDDEIPAAIATVYAKLPPVEVLELITDCLCFMLAVQAVEGSSDWAARVSEGGAAFYHTRNGQAAGFRAAKWELLQTLEKLSGCYEACWLQWSRAAVVAAPALRLRNSFDTE